VSALFSAIGGAMFTLQVGFMSPSFVGIIPSIEMVIFAAVGGRMSLIGAVYGTLLVNWGKTAFSESFPELWLFLMGGLFIAVVMAFPNGLAGVLHADWVRNLRSGRYTGAATARVVAFRAAVRSTRPMVVPRGGVPPQSASSGN
jgi:urea transport system permease protein